MVTYHVLGHRGMLGSVVTRRWAEHGAEWTPVPTADHIVNCVYPDSWKLLEMLPKDRVIQPSTDAINEDTPYACTKREVERIVLNAGGLVIRSGLVDLRKQPTLAYINWFGNPLTPLEWADLAWELRERSGLYADGREPRTRYGLASEIATEWGLEQPHTAMAHLSNIRILPPSREWPKLHEALRAYHEWLG
jgi:hypothetical protein